MAWMRWYLLHRSVPRLAQDLCCGLVAFMGEWGSLRGAEG